MKSSIFCEKFDKFVSKSKEEKTRCLETPVITLLQLCNHCSCNIGDSHDGSRSVRRFLDPRARTSSGGRTVAPERKQFLLKRHLPGLFRLKLNVISRPGRSQGLLYKQPRD